VEFPTAVFVVTDDIILHKLMLHYIFRTFHLATNMISWGISSLTLYIWEYHKYYIWCLWA
jgi:hypothetical protein